MRRGLAVSVLVSAMMAVTLAIAPAASAAGDKFAGIWVHPDGVSTQEITPVSEGVYKVWNFTPGYCSGGTWEGGDTAAVAAGDVITFDYTTTACPGGSPDPVGKVYPDRTLTLQEDGTLVHGRPDGNEVTLVRATTQFFDVAVGRFYTDAVTWLASEGITTGTSLTTYSPGDPVTRAQMATFLWRYDGRPEPASLDTAFTDVVAGTFYAKAVAWLAEEKITTGTTPTTFSPDDSVTRGQMATFLWRYSGSPEPASLDSPFIDVVAGSFYEKAVAWLVEMGITTGTSPNTFSPDDPVTRGQMATFLWRLAGEPTV